MRLIDADRLKRQVEGRSWRAKGKMVELIDNSPTIRVGENTCKHRTPDGVCKLYTDEHFTSFCVDGPCPNEEPITEDEAPDVKHGRWVPVSERLPEDNSDILVTYVEKDEKRIAPVNYGCGTWFDCLFNKVLDQVGVLAWMPLPEPYKEGEKE